MSTACRAEAGSTGNTLLDAVLGALEGWEDGSCRGVDELAGFLELVDVAPGQLLHRAGAPVQDVFFPYQR